MIDPILINYMNAGKSGKQLAKAERGIIVRDDIEYGHGNIVPLWLFGLNY